MLKLNKETGDLTWDKYNISPLETWDTFGEKYADFKLVFERKSPEDVITERIFHAPIIDFHSQRIQLEVVFYTHYISGLNIHRIAENLGNDPKFWTSELLHWVEKSHEWLRSQLGKPHTTKAGVLSDEHERMTIYEINKLKSYEYIFDWGCAGFYYDGLQQPGDIFIHPSYHHQIRNWDELLAECDYLTQNAEKHKIPRSENLSAVRQVIEAIQNDFDYQEVYPRVFSDSLIFDLEPYSNWHHIPSVHVDVNLSRTRGVYRVTRTDTTRKLYTSDIDTLIAGLREFIAGENL